MDDIASLGLEVDSAQVVNARRELDKFASSGKVAEDVLRRIEAAARMGGTATQGYGQALAQAYGITGRMTEAQVSAIRQYETMIAKTELLNQGRGREAAQLVAVRKAGTTANTEYGKTVAGLAGTLYDLEQQQNKTDGSANRFANTLTRRFIVGYIISQLRELISTVVSLNTELAKTGDVGRFTGLGSQGIQGIQYAGALKGVDSAKMLDDMTNFAAQVNLAKQGLGDLNTLFKLNGVYARDTEDAFYKVADLVRNASREIEKQAILRAAGLPTSREFVRLMEQGSEAIRKQGEQAQKVSDDQIQAAQELEEKFNKLWADFIRWGKGAILEVAQFPKAGSPLGDLIEMAKGNKPWTIKFDIEFGAKDGTIVGDIAKWIAGKQGLPDPTIKIPKFEGLPTIPVERGGPLPPLGGATGANGNNAGTRTLEQLQAAQKSISLQQQYIGLLGQTATAEQQVLAVRLQIRAYQLDPNAARLSKDQIENLERLARERALGIDTMKAQSDAYRVEADTIGMSVGRAAEYTAIQNQLNEAKRAGREVSEQSRAAIEAEARSLGNAAERADNMRFGYDTFSGTMREFGSNIRNGQTAMEAFGNAGVNALGKIADRLMDMASRQLWQMAFPSGGGGLFSLLGLGGGGELPGWGTDAFVGPIASAKGNVFSGPGISAYSSMVISKPTLFPFAKGMGLMGEAGAEGILPLRRGPDGRLGVIASGGSGGMSLSVVNHNDFRGVDPSMRAFILAQQRVSEERTKREVIAEVSKMNKNSPGYLRKGN